MKTLKFFGSLPEIILRGEKKVTWRINDEKDLSAGDTVSFCRNDGKEFAIARLTKVKKTTFGKLTEEDWEGHERYSSDVEMYRWYSEHYKTNVDKNTELKIIWFDIT